MSAVRLITLLFGLLLAADGSAQQYRSETREIETPPAQQEPADVKAQLATTTDPYAKAMLLRELAGAAALAKKYPEAKKYLEQALALGALSGPAAAQMKKDVASLGAASAPEIKAGNYKAQIPQLEKRAKEPGAPPEIFIALGAGYAEAKRFNDAIVWLKKGIAEVPNPDPTWKRALLANLLAAGRDAEALPLAQEQVKRRPQEREAWLQLAALALKAGDKERAAAVLELAGRQGHLKNEAERLQLVTLTAQLGAPFAAASQAQTWLEQGLITRSAGNWATLGALWSRAREPGLASTALEEANRLSPDAQRLLQIGQLQMDREDYSRAANSLQKAIQAGAKSGPAWMMLAMVHYQQADVEAAGQAFQQAASYPASRKLAREWLAYLETGAAREEALAALTNRRPRDAGTVTLADKFAGGAVRVEGAAEPTYVPRETSTASATAGLLTPIGAEKGGTPDGRIPAWDGGLKAPPAGFVKGGRIVDPYPQDKPLFTITAATAAKYAAQLAPGHKALFAKYADYTMPVFPTRRSAAYPQAIYDATQANLSSAKLLGSDALSGAKLGFPFPKPQNGVEVMWNHRTRYRGDATQTQTTQAIVRPGSTPQYLKQTERVLYRYANLKRPADMSTSNILLYYLTWFGSTPNDVDFTALVHETANSEKDSRDVWVIPPKIPRMFRVPPVGYDQPFPGSDGIQFIDMVDMYNGAFDRYVWKLAGKRELFIPYNAHRMSSGAWKYPQLLKPDHLNQEATRYELHRVWVIEATERGGKRHVFGTRTFYVDEDSWNVVLVENEDREGRLWRFQEGHLVTLYENLSTNCLPVVTYDLKDGRYFINRLLGEDRPPLEVADMKETEFLPAAVRSRYTR